MSQTKSFALALSLLLASQTAHAALLVFEGGLAAEAAWRANVGSYLLEGFESLPTGSQVSTLPTLGVQFDLLEDGVNYPTIFGYIPSATPSGGHNISNMPSGCCHPAWQYHDIVMRAMPGQNIYAMGFWQADPNGSFTARVYDASDVLLGTFVGGVNNGNYLTTQSFGGFVSSTPIGYIVFDGNHGDGYNHLDDFQVGLELPDVFDVPAPAASLFMLAGLIALRRR